MKNNSFSIHFVYFCIFSLVSFFSSFGPLLAKKDPSKFLSDFISVMPKLNVHGAASYFVIHAKMGRMGVRALLCSFFFDWANSASPRCPRKY